MIRRYPFSYKGLGVSVCLVSCAVFALLALFSFCPSDPSYMYDTVGHHTVTNFLGSYGAYGASLILYSFGGASFFIIAFLLVSALFALNVLSTKIYVRTGLGLASLFFATLLAMHWYQWDVFFGIAPGGRASFLLGSVASCFMDPAALYSVMVVLFVAGFMLLVRKKWLKRGALLIGALVRALVYNPVARFVAWGVSSFVFAFMFVTKKAFLFVWNGRVEHKEQETPASVFEYLVHQTVAHEFDHPVDGAIFEDDFWQSLRQKSVEKSCSKTEEDLYGQPYDFVENSDTFSVPSLDHFSSGKNTQASQVVHDAAQERAHVLEEKLARFGINGSVASVQVGPVVTLFEYAPSIDTKISTIIAREDDLALALRATSLRIIAPIPGRAVVGFEVANQDRVSVFFGDVASDDMTQTYRLPLVMGYDTMGSAVTIDLASLPHVLVAGSTGSGKSVCLNSFLMSLLCSYDPESLRLILVDPKRLEFASYADIAHLVFPVITQAPQAMRALQWAVQEMERRYQELADAGYRTMEDYTKDFGLAAMPYMVIIIDELADLMMVAGKEIEASIARLAQMARAAGIHLIVATQRPSVDVLTGLIKVNFPARISFKVTSKVDSRTILDTVGAEKLLGKGDMLFLDPKGLLSRLHGAYVADEEIRSVVATIRKQQDPAYESLDVFVAQQVEQQDTNDPLYAQVCEFVQGKDVISISLLQRYFRIGYNRSARIVDMLESNGVVAPADGGKMRKVIH